MAQDVRMVWMCCGFVLILFDWFLRVPSLHALVFIGNFFCDLYMFSDFTVLSLLCCALHVFSCTCTCEKGPPWKSAVSWGGFSVIIYLYLYLTASPKTGPSCLAVPSAYQALWKLTPTTPCRDAFCCFPTALLINCVSQGLLNPRDKPQSYSLVATASTERYRFGYRPLGACWGFSALARSRTSYRSVVDQFNCTQCWAVQNAHKNMHILALSQANKVTCT